MASRSSNAPPDLEWKRDAVKAFRRVAATDAQKKWLRRQGVASDRPATEQNGRLDAILVRAEIDVLGNFRAEEPLSSGDKKFLKSKGIKPDTPAADQDARINELVTTLQQQANDALARQVTYDTQTPQASMTQGELEKMRQLVSSLRSSDPTVCGGLPEHADHPSCIYPRDCYQKGLDYVIQKQGEGTGYKIFRFGGTPGIGKTTFRYWILWLWVRGETNGLQQKHCLFSIGTSKLVLLTRERGDITVRGAGDPCNVYPAISPWSDDCVGVVEMSLPNQGIYKIPEESCPCASLLMIMGTPGKFVKGVSCFKAIAIASPYYFPTWDADEAAKLPVAHFTPDPSETVDEATIRRRCEEYGGVLRLMRNRSTDAESQINEALKSLTLKTINVVVEGGFHCGGETDKIHRLLRLDAAGHVDGFISDRVARVAMGYMNQVAETRTIKFMQTAANNPKGHALWGFFFEERFGQGFSQQKMKLTFKFTKQTRSGISELTAPSGGLQHYQRGQQNLTKGVLYQPPASFQGIDFFMLADNKTVYYLQATVSGRHSEVDTDHNDHTALDSAVKEHYKDNSKQHVKKHIIYVVPDKESADTFAVPKTPDGWVSSVAWPEPGVLQTAGHGGTKRSSEAEGAPAAKRPTN